MSKGDTPRPTDKKKYDEGYDRIFSKPLPPPVKNKTIYRFTRHRGTNLPNLKVVKKEEK